MPKYQKTGLYHKGGSMPGSPLGLGDSGSPGLGGPAQYVAVQPTNQHVGQAPSPQRQIIQTQSGQQVVFLQDNNGQAQRVVMQEAAKPRQQVQQIQIPASMAGHQLVVAQMPDGRQQIFALQGGAQNPNPLQLIQQQGIQQVQHVSLLSILRNIWQWPLLIS